MPFALGFSYPAVFIAGSVSVTVAAVLWKTPSRGGWIAWAAYNFALAGGFLASYLLTIHGQAHAELGLMVSQWGDAFPPQGSIAAVFAWLFEVHAGPLFAQPVGGEHWGSIGTALLCLAAVVALVRQTRYRLLLLCAAPFALNLIAAFLRRYPYGGHMRLTMHVGPIVCILAGIGLAAILKLRWKLGPPLPMEEGRRPEIFTRPIAISLALLMILGLATAARDCCLPGKEQQEIRKRDFARWFWGSMERDHEVVCIATDLGRTFPPQGVSWQLCIAPQFLCNERIYSPRHARGELPDLTRVSRQRPLACVQYWSHMTPYDDGAFYTWFAEMQRDYDYVGCHQLPMLSDNDNDRVPEPPDRIEVYEFVPKGSIHLAVAR